MQKHNNIASEVGELKIIHLQGSVLEISSPHIQQCDWSIVSTMVQMAKNSTISSTVTYVSIMDVVSSKTVQSWVRFKGSHSEIIFSMSE